MPRVSRFRNLWLIESCLETLWGPSFIQTHVSKFKKPATQSRVCLIRSGLMAADFLSQVSGTGEQRWESQEWGAEGFSGCKICRRDRRFPNPVLNDRPIAPYLRFAITRHQECNMCLGYLRIAHPGLKKDALAKKLQGSDDYNEHCVGVRNFENRQNGCSVGPKAAAEEGAGRRRRRSG